MANRAWSAFPACSARGLCPECQRTRRRACCRDRAGGSRDRTDLEDGANGVAIWVHPADPAKSLILGAGGSGGLEVYGLDGALRQRIGDIEACM